MDPQPVMKAEKFIAKHWFLSAFLGAVALVAIAVGAYYYNQYQNAQSLLKNPNLAVEKQTNVLVGQVSKLMMLPSDETPTVATVTDASKLKDQAFFADAVNGDKVLIYVKARKAILYDPVKNIIVDVAPVNIANNQQPQIAPTGSVSPTAAYVPPTAAPTVVPTAPVTPTVTPAR